MKLFHLADLHIGKRVNGFSMIEDQKEVLGLILDLVLQHKPDAVLIAGDVYDAPLPTGEAVAVLDGFLTSLAKAGVPVMIISGNHDSPERLSFLSSIMGSSGVHIAPVYAGQSAALTLFDDHGPVHFYLLPFIKPAQVRRFFPDGDIASYQDAVATALGAMQVDVDARNVLITHQLITGATRSDSEEISIGGADNIDGALFSAFDYVALGHLHGPQNAYGPRVRYCGSPLKYSFSESRHKKSVTVVELGKKGEVAINTLPLVVSRDMREVRGSFEEVQKTPGNPSDYLRIILTDEEDIPDAMARLRQSYPNLMRLEYDNTRTRAYQQVKGARQAAQKTPLELLDALYELTNNQPMNEKQRQFASQQISKVWEGEA